MKGQPYSLQDMLADDDAVDAVRRRDGVSGVPERDNYHRWHSPVTGTIDRSVCAGGDLLLGGRIGGRGPRAR